MTKGKSRARLLSTGLCVWPSRLFHAPATTHTEATVTIFQRAYFANCVQIPERAADMRHPILEGADAASSAPAGNNLHSPAMSIVKAGQDAAFAQLQLSRPLQRPQPPAQTASSLPHPHAR